MMACAKCIDSSANHSSEDKSDCLCECHGFEIRNKYAEQISETTKLSGTPIPARMVSMEVALQDFYLEMSEMVINNAKKKGYHGNDEDGRVLFDFVTKYSEGHSIGEIIYKAIRWTKKRDNKDIVKIAAWAFLIWDGERRNNEVRVRGLGSQTMMEHEISKPSKEVAYSTSQTCGNCGYVHSAHKWIQTGGIGDAMRCPIQRPGRNDYFASKS